MSAHKSFEEIQEICKKYQNNEKYVYKACNSYPLLQRDWIVIMEKCIETATNEDRKDVVDEKYAKFRADKLKVIEIINKNNAIKYKCVSHKSDYDEQLPYEVGQIVRCDSFDLNIDIVCGGGIHYFKTLIAAYYYCHNPPKKGASKCMEWYDNGRQKSVINYYDGILDGVWKYCGKNGKHSLEGRYENGNKHGRWIERCDNGQLIESNYNFEKLDGRKTEYYANGQKSIEEHYKSDVMDGPRTEYYINGQIMSDEFYKNGRKDGLWKRWYATGRKYMEIRYDNDKECSHVMWDHNGDAHVYVLNDNKKIDY